MLAGGRRGAAFNGYCHFFSFIQWLQTHVLSRKSFLLKVLYIHKKRGESKKKRWLTSSLVTTRESKAIKPPPPPNIFKIFVYLRKVWPLVALMMPKGARSSYIIFSCFLKKKKSIALKFLFHISEDGITSSSTATCSGMMNKYHDAKKKKETLEFKKKQTNEIKTCIESHYT